MSIATCHDCQRYIDTDFDPASWIEIGNMRRQTETVCICEACRERREEEQDYWEAQESHAMEEAERLESEGASNG